MQQFKAQQQVSKRDAKDAQSKLRRQVADLELPLIFSAAENISGVIYWALIDDISVDGATTCRYSVIREVTPARPLSSLRLRRTGRTMPEQHPPLRHLPHAELP